MGGSGRLSAVAATVSLALMSLFAGVAGGERAQEGNLIVSLNGGVAPLALPRNQQAPVGVRLAGEIRTEDGSPLPQLDEVKIELAGPGRLSTRGLPKCPGARLRNASSRQAMYRCGEALVGRGSAEASIDIQGQNPFPIRGQILAFNGSARNRQPAIWLHIFSEDPPVSLALPFLIEPSYGSFKTSLVASLPRWTGPNPRLASFDLTLSRRYTFRGHDRSYASASCPVPQPFTAGFLTFARATYSFADERRLNVESVRSCRAI